MLKKVLWIAAACAAILVALAVSRSLHFDRPMQKTPAPALKVETTPPVSVPAPVAAAEVPPPSPPVEPTPDEQQIQDDAAATGMTTVEPEPSAEAPKP